MIPKIVPMEMFDVDVARAVQGIGHDQIAALCTRKDHGVLQLLARQTGAMASTTEHGNQGFVRDDVEFLDAFPLNVRLARPAEDVGEPGPPNPSGDQFGGQADLIQERREETRRAGHLEHALQNERLEGCSGVRRVGWSPGSFGHG